MIVPKSYVFVKTGVPNHILLKLNIWNRTKRFFSALFMNFRRWYAFINSSGCKALKIISKNSKIKPLRVSVRFMLITCWKSSENLKLKYYYELKWYLYVWNSRVHLCACTYCFEWCKFNSINWMEFYTY